MFTPARFTAWMRAGRAFAITLLLAMWTLEALPKPSLDPETLAKPANQRIVHALHATLHPLGISEQPEWVERRLLEGSARLASVRKAVLAPALSFYAMTGMQQRWALFRTGGRHGYRLQIDGRRADGSWTVLYRAHEADVFALGPSLTFRRLRGIYDGCKKDEASAQYEGFVDWVSQKLMAEHRELSGVRVKLERLRLGSRREATKPVSVQHERVRERET